MHFLSYKASHTEVAPENTIIVTHSGNSQLQLVINNLDPRVEYCVAIAASTVAGTSDFSNAQKVPCKYMSIVIVTEVTLLIIVITIL